MENIDIDIYINSLTSLLGVSQTYAQISSKHVTNIRDTVVRNRDFTSAVYSIFQEVVSSYSQEISNIAKQRRNGSKTNLTFLPHNGKTVYVFLSANTGLFGDVINKTFDYMLNDLDKSNAEVTVVGRLGLAMLQSRGLGKNYSYFDYPDYGMSQDKFSELVSHLVQYEEIQIYYAQFQSMVDQQPVKFTINAQTPMSVSIHRKEQKYYLFEPSLEDILKFFESEIFTSVMDQVLQEAQLAKSASRILAMNRATRNIEEELKKTRIRKSRIRHSTDNKKQVNSLIARIAIQRG